MEKTRIQDLVIGIIVSAIGLYGFTSGMKMPEGTRPYTMVVTGIFLALGLILVISTLMNAKKPTADTEFISFKTMINPLLAFCMILVYLVLLNVLGFFSGSAIFMLCFMFWMGYRKPIPMVLTTVIMLGFIYFLFVMQLKVRLPSGFMM